MTSKYVFWIVLRDRKPEPETLEQLYQNGDRLDEVLFVGDEQPKEEFKTTEIEPKTSGSKCDHSTAIFNDIFDQRLRGELKWNEVLK